MKRELTSTALCQADEIMLSELLKLDETRAIAIRFVAGTAKILREMQAAVPDDHKANADAVIQLLHFISPGARNEAFEEGYSHYRKKEKERPGFKKPN